MTYTKFAAAMIALGLAGSAGAHVTLEQGTAPAGSYYKATLRVSHGCEGSPTRALTVFVPEGFQGAKPMPKAGWETGVKVDKLAKAYASHGKTVTEDVVAVSWKGGALPDAHFDEFSLFGKLPAQDGKMHFKVLQECESGKNEWFWIPGDSKSAGDYAHPAAELILTKPQSQQHKH